MTRAHKEHRGLGANVVQRLLPHRRPFLFVDRIDELESHRRVVGSRTWSSSEALVTLADGSLAVPVPYRVECMAQIVAALRMVCSCRAT